MERNPTHKSTDEVSKRIDRFEGTVGKRFDAVDRRFERFEDKVDERFDKVDEKFREVDRRFDTVATKKDIADLTKRLDKWGTNISRGVFAVVVGVILKVLGV